MMNVSETPERDRFSERFFAWGNDIIDIILNHPWATLVVVLILVVSAILFAKCNRITIESIGPVKFSKKLPKNKQSHFPRRITVLPAPKPKNTNVELPTWTIPLINGLIYGQRKHILIQCSDQSRAEELGRVLYHKLESEKICDYVGWIHYEKGETERPLIEERIDREFSIYAEIENYDVRRSKRISFLDNDKQHTVLFVNVITYQKEKDCVLERYSNCKGLSMVLLSSVEIEGFDTFPLPRNWGKSLCKSKN